MSWRIVVISNQCKLDLKMGYMVVRGEEKKRVFLEEIAILIIENPAVSLTGCLLEELIRQKIKVIFCDISHSPFAELVPYNGCYDDSRKIRTQIKWEESVKTLIWEEIVAEKIKKQAEFLYELEKIEEANLISSYISQIADKDYSNREGFAAKVYFNALFGKEFTRSDDNAINSSLNYGYTILLSTFNREIVANGYLTQLGLFHNNMFNHFNLSSDFMEPYRILVDRLVYKLNPTEFNDEIKHKLWNLLNEKVQINDSNQYVLNAIRIYVRSVFESINENDVSKIHNYTKEILDE